MADSMIPYSFTPGTKAKAGEVNANFIALASIIETFKNNTTQNISDIIETLNGKVEPDDLINNFVVTETGKNLNDYKTPGNYIFSSSNLPLNVPEGNSGLVMVLGDINSTITQLWYSYSASQVYIRIFSNSNWTSWKPAYGTYRLSNPGFIKFSNGVILQWGHCIQNKQVVYPLAYNTIACPIFMKHGYGTSTERSDTGFVDQTHTGFTAGTNGVFYHLNWISIGW